MLWIILCRYDLERHAVHVNVDTNDTAVIGVLYEIGQDDPFLSQVIPSACVYLPLLNINMRITIKLN